MKRLLALAASLSLAAPARADDWPQWMGPNRDAVWAESGIVKQFPDKGLKPLWKVPVALGYSGPAVADGRVFVFERVLAKGAVDSDDPFDVRETKSAERLRCLDAQTGKELWRHEYECPYKISYPFGPRCTPAVADGKVYALGAMGHLHCLAADSGKVLWAKHFKTDYGARTPLWGFCGHPLVYKNLLVCVVGGKGATAVAFDKDTGDEKWRALDAREPGYAPPTVIRAGGTDQLLIWHAHALNSLDPLTGKPYWAVELEPMHGMSIMAPRLHGGHLFAGGIGTCAVLKLDPAKPAASVLWHAKAEPNGAKFTARGLCPVNMTPFIDDGIIYGADQPGMFRAVDLLTGQKLWSRYAPVLGREEGDDYKGAASGTAFVVKNGDRYFLMAETGDLIIARLTPKGYEELGRTHLLDPTGSAFGRKVLWSHPAFANKCVYVRNDKELACFPLAEGPLK